MSDNSKVARPAWLARIARLSGSQRRAVIEAGLALTWAAIQMRILPFGRTTKLRRLVDGEAPQPTAYQSQQAVALTRTLQRVANHTPWTSTCLMQSLAAETMLRRRHIPATVVLGVAKADGTYDAHSWLMCGDDVLTGAAGRERFNAVASLTADLNNGARRGAR